MGLQGKMIAARYGALTFGDLMVALGCGGWEVVEEIGRDWDVKCCIEAYRR